MWKSSIQKAMIAELSALRDEYISLRPSDKERHPEASEELKRIFSCIDLGSRGKRSKISHLMIRSASRLLIDLLPDDKLDLRIAQIRKHIDDLPKSDVLSENFKDKMAKVSSLNPHEKRAVAGELQRVRSSASISRINADVFKATVVNASLLSAFFFMIIMALIVIFLAKACQSHLMLFPFAAIFGAFGAWISTTTRLRDANPYELARVAELDTVNTSTIWISPVFGAIGAVLVYGGINAGLVQIPLFQQLNDSSVAVCEPGALNSVFIIFSHFSNKQNIGSTFLLALISLAAGWSERLVPDMLEWVGEKHSITQRK